MVRTVTSVIYVSEMLKRRLGVIRRGSACHGKLQSASIESSEVSKTT